MATFPRQQDHEVPLRRSPGHVTQHSSRVHKAQAARQIAGGSIIMVLSRLANHESIWQTEGAGQEGTSATLTHSTHHMGQATKSGQHAITGPFSNRWGAAGHSWALCVSAAEAAMKGYIHVHGNCVPNRSWQVTARNHHSIPSACLSKARIKRLGLGKAVCACVI